MLTFEPWKRWLILGLCALGILFALPNAVPEHLRNQIPDWLPNQSVNLGLDLRGGAHLLVEVQVQEVVAERMQSLRAEVRQALRDAGIRRNSPPRATESDVTVRITNAEDVPAATTALEGLARPIGGLAAGGGFGMAGGIAGGSDLVVEAVGDQSFRLSMSDVALSALTERTMAQSLEIIRKRIDESGTREPSIQLQGADRILIQVPGVGSAQEVLDIIGKTAKLTFHQVYDFGSDLGSPGPGRVIVGDPVDGIDYLLDRRAILSGENLVDAQLGFHPENGLPVVNFRFDTDGARIFGRYTSAHVGELFAIVLDNEVITAPRIQSAILGGSGFIEGNFTVESATALSIQVRSGALPASIKVEEERTVGPDLGADSVAAGTAATLLAFVAVLIFMGVSYRRFGVFADIALVVNVGLIIGLLSLLGATLTLPGIAGIVLTIGMAVDANVLIFERIREELKTAKNPVRAIERGYEQAFSAIIDANITTLIAAVILFGVGSGPVKGFAVTLGLGVITSVFTATVLTRLMIAIWVRRARPKTIDMSRLRLIPEATKIRFMGMRKIAIVASILLVIGSMAVTAVSGLNFGIDFRGGTIVEVQTAEPADLGQIRGIVRGMELGDVAVQSFGSERDVLVRVEEQRLDGDDRVAVARQVAASLQAEIPGTEIRRVEVVGPKVSGELLQAGILAVGLAVLAVLIYIWLRFEWQFGLGAVVALIHDVALTIGLFALTGIEFNLAIIAAILTIVGYSLNDTVVVYDRVRENLRKYKQTTLSDVLDLSLNETLSRTIMTSVTTLIALGAMFILGPAVIQGFTLAMIWGVIVGTYSSVFVAAATLLWLGVRRDWGTSDETKAGVQFGGAQV